MKRRLARLRSLPRLHGAEAAGPVFVHAGVDPGRFPVCGEVVHMGTRRREFLGPACWTAPRRKRRRMVYGHTPTRGSLPEQAGDGRRVNMETGAVYAGRLTAVLPGGGDPDLLFRTWSPVLLQQ